MNTDPTREILEEALLTYAGRKGDLLVALQDIQFRLGYIPADILPSVERVLGLPQGEAASVVSFYRELRTDPPARHHIRVCDGDSCSALGSRHLVRTLEEHTGTSSGGENPEGRVCHDRVYCLGNCALSPSVSIDGEVYGRVTAESLLRRLEELDRD